VGAGHHFEAAVAEVDMVERQPGRDAGARVDVQVEVVLMQRLA
jgi:hypothetical protein